MWGARWQNRERQMSARGLSPTRGTVTQWFGSKSFLVSKHTRTRGRCAASRRCTPAQATPLLSTRRIFRVAVMRNRTRPTGCSQGTVHRCGEEMHIRPELVRCLTASVFRKIIERRPVHPFPGRMGPVMGEVGQTPRRIPLARRKRCKNRPRRPYLQTHILMNPSGKESSPCTASSE